MELFDDEDLRDLSDMSVNAHIEHGAMIGAVFDLFRYRFSGGEEPHALDAETIKKYQGIIRTIAGRLANPDTPQEMHEVIRRYDDLVSDISEEY